jgi:Uncharacterized protein conserved in bacteria with a cystatin-like fold
VTQSADTTPASKGAAIRSRSASAKIIALSDDIVYVTGDYEFSAVRDGERQMAPARFTMVLVRHGRDWLITHHHSSRQLESSRSGCGAPVRRRMITRGRRLRPPSRARLGFLA